MKGLHAVVVLALAAGTAQDLVGQDDDAPPELQGIVISSTTGEPVGGAWIALAANSDLSTYSREDGAFSVPGVPKGPQQYVVQALAYETATVTLDPASGSQPVEISPEPTLLERLGALEKQLEGRRNRVGRVRTFGREDLTFAPDQTLEGFLRRRGLPRPETVCLDDAPGGEFAVSWPPADVYFVESLQNAKVLRLYTEDFFRRLITTGRDLGAKGNLPLQC